MAGFGRLYLRYRRTFWIAHSAWAMASGAVVVVLARERYELVPWVVAFLGLTWLSTLLFTRAGILASGSRVVRLSRGVASYLTRVMYQETLFFLFPFYLASTTLRSLNVVFIAVLAVLAVVACLDLLFDRLLREHPVFAFSFFSIVTFAALNFLLPLMLALRLRIAMPVAAGAAFAAAIPLAFSGQRRTDVTRVIGLASALCLVAAAVLLLRTAVPPVPLRLVSPTFARSIDPASLALNQPFGDSVSLDRLNGVIVFGCRVVAPSRLPTTLAVEWTLDGEPLHLSRQVEVIAHHGGFRLWDSTRRTHHSPRPGRYVVTVLTDDGQLVGRARLDVVP